MTKLTYILITLCVYISPTRSLNLQSIISAAKPAKPFHKPSPTQQTLSYLYHVGGKGDALSNVYVRLAASSSELKPDEWFRVGFITACTYDEQEEEVRAAWIGLGV